MPSDRLRSIVPMFGGATQYVDTLDSILTFVETHQPTTDELIGWHRGTFANVSSRKSIMRRVRYLQQAEFLDNTDEQWTLGPTGREYLQAGDTETLLRFMCQRNVGLRSLLYALSTGPLTITEISDQQLDTHPELGWSRGETDMAKQRANWLRSMGLAERHDDEYTLSAEGRAFVEDAVSEWAHAEWATTGSEADMQASTYETTVHARAVDPEFRATVLSRHDRVCPVSGVDHPGLLDVAHILPWSEYPDYRADLTNVLPLSKLHHAAFDQELFTIDQDYRLRVNPNFETESSLLQQTLLEQANDKLQLLEGNLDAEYLAEYNADLAWVS